MPGEDQEDVVPQAETEEAAGEVVSEQELTKMERKVAIAAALILTAGHRQPGVRGWELRRRLGKGYQRVLEALDSRLKKIGLRLKVVYEDESQNPERARYYVVVSEPLALSDLTTLGYSIDEVAILAATLAYLFASNDRRPYKEVVELLETKYPKWRVESVLERLIRRGYLVRTEDDQLVVGWRAKVEVDKKELLRAIASLGQVFSEQRSAQAESGTTPSESQT
ncbi:MAG: hypothetical protein ACO2O1_08060 [Candidatus Caldarchaeales archaeon]